MRFTSPLQVYPCRTIHSHGRKESARLIAPVQRGGLHSSVRKRVPKDASNTCSVIRDAHETFSISSGRVGIARVAIDEPPTKASGNTRTVDRSRVVPRRRCHASEAQKITLLFLEIVANETKREFIVLVPSAKSSECPNVSLQTARIKVESRYPPNCRSSATVVRTILQWILHGGGAACQFH